jgi:hypothetical protein
MVWVYERTDGSLLVAILMHASLAACTIILIPPLALTANLSSGLAYAAALWLVVAAVAIAQGGHLSRQPLHKPGYKNDQLVANLPPFLRIDDGRPRAVTLSALGAGQHPTSPTAFRPARLGRSTLAKRVLTSDCRVGTVRQRKAAMPGSEQPSSEPAAPTQTARDAFWAAAELPAGF